VADTQDSHRDFLVRLVAALGWNQADANEQDILAEILRLREAAGEAGEPRLLSKTETLSVVSVRAFPPLPRDPGEPPFRTTLLLVTTRAGVVEVTGGTEGEEPQHFLIEHPERLLVLAMNEDEARQAYEILGRAIAGWDEDAP
jgi:hypothetical protein